MSEGTSIRRLFIANRGEIAVRIIRAAHELGIETIQAHSTADAESLAVRLAGSAVDIGPPAAAKSYLNIEAVIEAARNSGADAVHPGYGFLAENAAFAEAVVDAGMIFVGPSADVIRQMGDKNTARGMATKAGVPVVPGSDGLITNMADARALAEQMGYPVMIKATAGGGGRGIRLVHTPDEFDQQAPQAASEAKAAFGDGGIYIEKLIAQARHVEVQIIGDGKRAVHCFERECSLQRRRQKVWEEAPCSVLPDTTRQQLCKAAVALAEAVGYQGVGTVEFLYDDASDSFYFIEMNTRIQVEHPVTEALLDIDLIAEMLRVAAGQPLRFDQDDLVMRGHAIEVRINAEDPAANFMPFPGVVDTLAVPGGPGTRFDHLLYSGYAIPPFYDSMLGKLIVHAESRPAAIARMKRALDELVVSGVKTTLPLHQALVDDEDVQANRVHTNWLEHWLETHGPQLTTAQQESHS